MGLLRFAPVAFGFAVFTSLILGSSFLSMGDATAGELQDQAAQELTTPRNFTPAELRTIQATQFIFIDGMFGDHFKENFEPAVAVLNTEWHAENTVIFPRSLNSMPTNSEILYQEVKTLRKNSKKKQAILITHSKGAAETMMMLLQHPDVVSDLGFTQFLQISSPLGGTNIVEFVNTLCNGSEGNHEPCTMLNSDFPSAEGFASEVVQPIYTAGLAALTPAEKSALQSKTYYVETQMPDDDFRSPLFTPHLWMEVSHPEDGPNDGAIPTKYELMQEKGFGPEAGPVFGTDLGIMMGDHNSLMNKAKTPAELAFRQAFFKVLINRVLLGHSKQ
jgi:hypothetical protein